MPTATSGKRKLTTTEKGLGWRHEQAVDDLFVALPDGSPCPWCARPRWKDRTRNHDYKPNSTNPASGKLQGDHSAMSRSECLRRGLPIPPPDRLLHQECNRQRGDGSNDHLAAESHNRTPADDIRLQLPWPW